MAKVDSNRKRKQSLISKIVRAVIKFCIYFLLVSIFWVIALKFINPPITLLMILKNIERKSDGKPTKLEKKWVKLGDISSNMKLAAVAAEDQLFLSHMGFDVKALESAYKNNAKGKKIKGGSTISQQTAKNVFLWPGRSYIRKAFEAYFTVLIETLWSKERILEVYLNVIEMGDGIYGAEAASMAYYKRSCKTLTKNQAALIAACFPNPIRWTPKNATPYIKHRQYLIVRNMKRLGPLDF